MAESTREPSDAEIWDQQVFRYAEELQELYRQEQKEREALAEEKLVLQFRLRELSSLNELFQKQLEESEGMLDLLKQAESELTAALETKSLREAKAAIEPLLVRIKALLEGL